MDILNTDNKRLKIGCVTSSVSYFGGWGTLSKGIIGAIAKFHNVITLTAKGEPNDKVPYPTHDVLPENYVKFHLRNQIIVFWQCLKYFRGCDAIHTFVEPFTPGAALASKVLGVPLFITLAGTYCVIPKAGGIRGFVKRTIMKFMYKQASFIATGSNRNIELIEEVMPLHNKWHYVPFGVDPEKYPTDGNKIYEKSPYPFLLTVGAVKPRKGADYVLRALGLLRDEFPTLRYKIAGGYSEETKFVKEIRSLIKENKLDGRVEILGRVNDKDLLKLYGTCAVFVLAAQTTPDGAFEGFPAVLYEAQSLGAPVISTYGFGSEYVIKNGRNGFLVPQNNYVDLAEAIRKILCNPLLRSEMSKSGIEEARKHTWDDIGVYYLDGYRSVILRTKYKYD